MIASGQRHPSEIAILVTQRASTIKRLCAALDAAEVPYALIDKEAAPRFDPTFPHVKVMTVHAAKGHKFGVTVLFGLEALPDPSDGETESVRRGRVGFVGMTRAKDQLLITYSKDNCYLKRLKGLGSDLRQWTWPDQYEV